MFYVIMLSPTMLPFSIGAMGLLAELFVGVMLAATAPPPADFSCV